MHLIDRPAHASHGFRGFRLELVQYTYNIVGLKFSVHFHFEVQLLSEYPRTGWFGHSREIASFPAIRSDGADKLGTNPTLRQTLSPSAKIRTRDLDKP